MAIVIVEGVDFSGKTTLVQKLQKDLNLFSIKSPRPKSMEHAVDLIHATEAFAHDQDVICDRHCLISEPIYSGVLRDHQPSVLPYGLAEFHLSGLRERVIVVWCDPGLEHIQSMNNDQMEGVKENVEALYAAYNSWLPQLMDEFFILTYNFKHDDYEDLKDEIAFNLDHREMKMPDKETSDVEAFHTKFSVDTPLVLTNLEGEVRDFRFKFLQEELDEFKAAVVANDFVTAFDSLLDLTYVAKGTALFMGIDAHTWASGWDIVQNANMQKQRAQSASESKRGTSLDVIKPPGWNENHKPEPKLKKLLGL